MSAAACPRMIALNGTPSSPTSLRNRVQDRRPSSPTIKIRGQMTLPSIATICSSPSSPTKFAVFKCPVSPTPQMKTAQVTSTAVSDLSTSATAATFSNLSISSNKREQPLAGASPVAVTGGKRKLGKGCGLLDWIRLCRTKKGELGGPGGEKRPVTLAELAQHNTEDDAWTAIRGMLIYTNTCCASYLGVHLTFADAAHTLNNNAWPLSTLIHVHPTLPRCRKSLQHHPLRQIPPWWQRRSDEGCWNRLQHHFWWGNCHSLLCNTYMGIL